MGLQRVKHDWTTFTFTLNGGWFRGEWMKGRNVNLVLSAQRGTFFQFNHLEGCFLTHTKVEYRWLAACDSWGRREILQWKFQVSWEKVGIQSLVSTVLEPGFARWKSVERSSRVLDGGETWHCHCGVTGHFCLFKNQVTSSVFSLHPF